MYSKILAASFLVSIMMVSCSIPRKLSHIANTTLLKDSAISSGHIGISVYEPATNKYWFNFQGDKFFIPASNTKLFSLYAGMKYLGDSLPGLQFADNGKEIIIKATGDPSFLHPDFPHQPVYDFLKQQKKPIVIMDNGWKEDAWGEGWAWNDYNDDYMAERSPFPVYGNVITWTQSKETDLEGKVGTLIYSDPEVNWKTNFSDDTTSNIFQVKRNRDANVFTLTFGSEKSKKIQVPFFTDGYNSALSLLEDTLHKKIIPVPSSKTIFKTIHTQPADSLFTPMMHRSDNFFAEQTLLMVSQQRLGYMNDASIIDTLLKTDLKGLPQKPKWVDGSGLSRYNLITPQDFVFILNKLRTDFGLDRLKVILPTGGTGTLRSYYQKDKGFIFAKTGSLSNNLALSGFLITKKDKLLVFSVLLNNFQGSGTRARKAIESFIEGIREKY